MEGTPYASVEVPMENIPLLLPMSQCLAFTAASVSVMAMYGVMEATFSVQFGDVVPMPKLRSVNLPTSLSAPPRSVENERAPEVVPTLVLFVMIPVMAPVVVPVLLPIELVLNEILAPVPVAAEKLVKKAASVVIPAPVFITSSFACGEEVPTPTFPAAVTTKAVSVVEPIKNDGMRFAPVKPIEKRPPGEVVPTPTLPAIPPAVAMEK